MADFKLISVKKVNRHSYPSAGLDRPLGLKEV
jgi:hypothetical protein